jgi:branched-subunit amino acid ABC-type transport system permease component
VVVVRPLRESSALSRVVASLGLFLYFQELVRLRFPTAGAAVTQRLPVLPETPVHLLGTHVSANRLWLALIAIVAAAGLWWLFHHTRFGLVTRAASESDKGALLLGLRADRAGALSWVLATVLGGLAVILIEPIAGLDVTTTSLLVVPALAAALAGGLSSFGVTVAAGLGIGMLQSVILGYAVQPDVTWIPRWLPTTGLQQLVPVAIVLVVLAWRGDVIPSRGALAERHPPTSPPVRHPVAVLAAIAISGTVLAATLGAGGRGGLVVSMVAAILSLSVVVITGLVGQISLVQLALAGISGFTVVHLARGGVPFPLDLFAGAAVAAGLGVVVGSVSSRLRGMTFAVATLTVAVALEQLVMASPSFSGGAAGSSAPRPHLFGLDLGSSAAGDADVRPAFVLTVLVALLAATALVMNLRRRPTGLRWLAIRANPRAAAAAGIDVGRSRLAAFAVSAFLAGLSGGLTAYSTSTLSPASFMVIGSLVVVALTYLAGVSSVTGALIAGLITQAGLLTALTANGSDGSDSIYAISGIALVAAAIYAPDGLTGTTRRLVSAVREGRA